MNNLIVIPLLVLFLAGAFCQLLAISDLDMASTATYTTTNGSSSQNVNGSTNTYSQESANADFTVNMTTGLIALIIGLVVVGAVAGIQVLGSGLSDFSVQLIYKSVVYYGLWFMFSALSYNGWASLPFFGAMIWLGLTLVYSLGFFQTMGAGGE